MFNWRWTRIRLAIILSRSTRACRARPRLASKATGYPIARVAAKIAIGLHWTRLRTA